MMALAAHAAWCGLSTAVGVVVNWAVEFGPASWRRDIWGTPWISWRIGVIYQSLVFPPLLALAVAHWWRAAADPSLANWLHSAWAENGAALAAHHYAFFGYLMKDMFVKMDALLYLHHVVSLVLTVLSIAEWPNQCSAVYVLRVPPASLSRGAAARGRTDARVGWSRTSRSARWPSASRASPFFSRRRPCFSRATTRAGTQSRRS